MLFLFTEAPLWAMDDKNNVKEESTITLDEVVVTANRVASSKAEDEFVPLGSDQHHVISNERARTSSTAGLLNDVPGVSLQQNGGVADIPVLHGLGDDRVRIKVDGMDLISACANHMNSPLSYINPTNVNNVQVFAGITPVSAGGDSIAGTVLVNSAEPEFAKGRRRHSAQRTNRRLLSQQRQCHGRQSFGDGGQRLF